MVLPLLSHPPHGEVETRRPGDTPGMGQGVEGALCNPFVPPLSTLERFLLPAHSAHEDPGSGKGPGHPAGEKGEAWLLPKAYCRVTDRERERERDCSHHWSTHLSQGWNQRPGVLSTSPTWGQGLSYLSFQCCPKFLQEPELSLNSRHSDTWCCCLNHYLTTRPTVCSLLPLDCFSILSPRTHQDFYYH